MFNVILFLFLGVALGFVFRRVKMLAHVGSTTRLTMLALLFVLGCSIGSQDSVVERFFSLIIIAGTVALLGTAGSLVMARVFLLTVWRGPVKSVGRFDMPDLGKASKQPAKGIVACLKKLYNGNAAVIILFLAGLMLGVMGKSPEMFLSSEFSAWILYLLIFQVGLGLGAGELFRELKSCFDVRMFLLPLFTIVGTLSFSLLAALAFGSIGVFDSLALGSGFGYYSLSSVIISQMGGDEAAALAGIALLANVIREMVAIVGCRFFMRVGGVFAPVSIAGVTSMDVCLPVIIKNCGGYAIVPLALVHGVVLEISVPLLVTLFCSL